MVCHVKCCNKTGMKMRLLFTNELEETKKYYVLMIQDE